MASINFDDYKKNTTQDTIERTYTLGHTTIPDTQYYIEEENVIFDFLELNFGKTGMGAEVWMSFLGEELKIRIDILSKEDLERVKTDKKFLAKLIGDYLSDNLGCLNCKSEFLEDICEMEHNPKEKDEEKGEED